MRPEPSFGASASEFFLGAQFRLGDYDGHALAPSLPFCSITSERPKGKARPSSMFWTISNRLFQGRAISFANSRTRD